MSLPRSTPSEKLRSAPTGGLAIARKKDVFRLFPRRTAGRKFLFPTFPFLVATRFLTSKIWALLLWESERENFHSKSFPPNGSSFFPPKVSIST